MSGRVGYSILDRSDERSSHTVYMPIITDLNFASQEGLKDAYTTALAGLTLGTVSIASFVADYEEISNTLPASPYAQREIKLLVRFQGNTNGKIYRVEIAAPDLANLTYQGNTDFIELADAGIMAAWVTAFEALAVAPDDDGELVTVISAQVVGRNI